MRLIIDIPEAMPSNEANLKDLATKTFGRCRVEVDRPEEAVEATKAEDAEQFATQARGLLALARRHQQPLSLSAFRFAVSRDLAMTTSEALRDSVARQCRTEDLLYCDSQGHLLILLPQTPDEGAFIFCQRMILMLQRALQTIGFSHVDEITYCALVQFDRDRHSAIVAMLHDAMTTLDEAVKSRQAARVIRSAV